VDTICRRHRGNSGLHRCHTHSRRTRTLRRRPRSKHNTSPDILHSRITVTISDLLRPCLRLLLAISGGSSSSAVALFSIIFIIGGAIFGLSEASSHTPSKKSPGRTLLWTAYAISIALGFVNYSSCRSAAADSGRSSRTGIFLFSGFPRRHTSRNLRNSILSREKKESSSTRSHRP